MTEQEHQTESVSVWVLSIAHISAFTARWLSEENALQEPNALRVLEWPDQYAIQVSVPFERPFDAQAIPPDLLRVLNAAYTRGFGRVEFDRDGLVFPGLPVYEWEPKEASDG